MAAILSYNILKEYQYILFGRYDWKRFQYLFTNILAILYWSTREFSTYLDNISNSLFLHQITGSDLYYGVGIVLYFTYTYIKWQV